MISNKINISIPTPCHEDWQKMTPLEKGKFCSSCQKQVHDFTKSSDSQILAVFDTNENLCGRFLVNQLNRPIEKPKNKKKKWLALATLTGFLSLGNQKIFAQGEPIRTEHREHKKVLSSETNKDSTQTRTITGVISDSQGFLPSATVEIKGTKKNSITNFDGEFTIQAATNDTLVFNYIGYKTIEKVITDETNYQITLEEDLDVVYESVIVGGICARRSFLGRLFQSVRNWFR
ncbi:carboxypeptidase-like regulatory domain-containing protein [Flavobacterium sp.]|uniref:carboxypeptidase-like regulatory domain-containing protein n=1 Tax=Flavobacterium sp. TaxID=239 RepID=UPI004048AF06